MIGWLRRHVRQQHTESTGAWGERLAREYLEGQGFQFIVANWTCRLGEIDVIMVAPDGTRVFVEVRTRGATTYGGGAETVHEQKQQKLIRAAQLYQQQQDYWGPVRFDVVAIEVRKGHEPRLEHIPHAFEVS